MKKGEGFGKPLVGGVWFSKASRGKKIWVAAHPTRGRRTAPDNIKGKAKSPAGPTGRWEGHWEGGKTWSPQVGGVVFPNPHMLSTWGIPRGDITLWVWGEAKMPSCPQVGGGALRNPYFQMTGLEVGKTWSPQEGGVVVPNPRVLLTWGIPRCVFTIWI
jgi:hypothetical protein